MTKITIIGAGSTVFAAQLITDILLTPAISSGAIGLVDIDPIRLELAEKMANFIIARTGRDWSVQASTDRTKILPGSQYVINTIEVAGLENVRNDYDIPLKYGIDQCIGDTIGPGGLFKALRTLPAWLEILADIERLAPRALVMNYTNPMSLTVLAGLRASPLPIVGLCHSIQSTSRDLARYLDIPYDELDWRAGGINHMAWFTRLERDGQDLYPRLVQAIQDESLYEQDAIRFETMRHLGAFVSESSGHFSEYVGYFRKRPDLLERYARSGYRGESGFYADNWPRWRREGDERIQAYLDGSLEFQPQRSHEYASYIIEAIQANTPSVIYGNVLNSGLIDNLPQDGVVEVACLVDRKGIQPVPFGNLPTQLAILCQAHMAFHDLVVRAVLERDREAAVQALMVDPLTSAVCSLAEIRQLFDEMAAAERAYLPEFVTS
jgi:alpha-galactosidase